MDTATARTEFNTPMFYRKRPVVIDAIRFDGANIGALQGFMGDTCPHECEGDRVMIHTPDGNMTADAGDWIIKNGEGEFRPCKPDTFAATYELAEA